MLSNLLLEFSKYSCEKWRWFLSICWRFNCFPKINKSSDVLSYVCISSDLMNGWSKMLIFSDRSYVIVIEFPLKLEKKWRTFYFRFTILYLCCCHNYSVKSLKLFIVMFSPKSFKKTINKRLQGIFIVFCYTDKHTCYHSMISINAWRSRLSFWKNGFRSWIHL